MGTQKNGLIEMVLLHTCFKLLGKNNFMIVSLTGPTHKQD